MAQIKFQNKLRKKSKKPLYTHFQQSMTSTKDYSNLSLTMATQLKNTFMKQKTIMSTVYLEFQVKEVPNLKKIGTPSALPASLGLWTQSTLSLD